MICCWLQLVLNALVGIMLPRMCRMPYSAETTRRLRLLHGKAMLVAIAILSRRQHTGSTSIANEIVYELTAAFCVGKLQESISATCMLMRFLVVFFGCLISTHTWHQYGLRHSAKQECLRVYIVASDTTGHGNFTNCIGGCPSQRSRGLSCTQR